MSHEERIAGAAAGDYELRDFVFRKHESAEGVHDRLGREIGHGIEEIGRPYFVLAGEVQEIFDVACAEVFTAGGFWWAKLEIGILHEAVNQRVVDVAATGERGVFIEAPAVFGEVGDERVDEDVGGAGVEGEDILGLGAGGDDGDVGDAAEIERDAAEFFVAVEEIVCKGDERGALASGGHVGGAEVGDGGDAGASGDDGGFAYLECR